MYEKGKCKHGTFDLASGCQQCIDESRVRHIVKVQYLTEATGELSDREYTYYSEARLERGDIIKVPVRGSMMTARVSAVDVPVAEIAAFKDKVKTIPAGAKMKPNIPPELEELEAGLNQEGLTLGQDAADITWKPNDALATIVDQGGDEIFVYGNPLEVSEKDKEFMEGRERVRDQILGRGVGDPVVITDELLEETALETAIALRPGEDLEAHGYFEQAMRALEIAKRRVIATVEDNEAANDDLSLIGKLRKAMEAKRKGLLGPLKVRADDIRATYDYLMMPIDQADRLTRDKMLTFDQDQKRIRAAQEEINRKRMEAAQAEMELNGELSQSVELIPVAPAPAKNVTTDLGSTGQRANWTYEVFDFGLLPDAYKVADSSQLTAIARKHHDQKPVAGVRFYNEPTIVNRPR